MQIGASFNFTVVSLISSAFTLLVVAVLSMMHVTVQCFDPVIFGATVVCN